MTFAYKTIDYFKTKLYQRDKEFQGFENIDEEALVSMSKKVYRKIELNEDRNNYHSNLNRCDEYKNMLEYLTNPGIHIIFPTYDEKILFLIMATDPNLIIYKEFLKTDIPSLGEILLIPDEKEKEIKLQERVNIIRNLEIRIREKIGFYDSKLLKYEIAYFKTFFSKRDLIPEVKQNNINNFLNQAKVIKSLNNVSQERYQEIIEKVELWISQINTNEKVKTAIYSITQQIDMLGLKSLEEQVIFFILATDPNLEMLRIFEEESLTPRIMERSIEYSGYYSPIIIHLEKIFHQRFCPEKEISIWSTLS